MSERDRQAISALAHELGGEPEPSQERVYVHILRSPDVCPVDGGEHVWDGEPLEFPDGWSVTCSKCGRDAMSVDLFCAP